MLILFILHLFQQSIRSILFRMMLRQFRSANILRLIILAEIINPTAKFNDLNSINNQIMNHQ